MGLGSESSVSSLEAEKMPLKSGSDSTEEGGGDVEVNVAVDVTNVVNAGQDDQMTIQGYKRNMLKTVLVWIGIILTVGFLRLIFYWKPNWYLKCTHSETDLDQATEVLLQDQYYQEFVETIKILESKGDEKFGNGHSTPLSTIQNGNGIFTSSMPVKYFVNKKLKYLYNEPNFQKLSGLEDGRLCSYFYEAHSLTTEEAQMRAVYYGKNVLDVHVTPVIVLVLKQAVNPFYIFQLFSCILWYTDEYEYYASAILAISIGSIALTTWSTRKMERALKNTVHQFGSATVRRDGNTQTMLPTDLVPGDIIEIPRTGMIMDVDAVLLTGNCIVNESMLTGESIPVTKTPLPNPHNCAMLYDFKHHSKHTLFCGTNVIQTRYYSDKPVTAMVIRTGFMTAKGSLLRSIMFPKPVDFKFYLDTYKFMLALVIISLLGMIYTLVFMIKRGYEAGLVARRVLDLITIAVPPALPAALSVGIVVSQNRLKNKWKIYCIMPSYINIAGSINAVCFDKTGTLTEDGLDMHGVLPSSDKSFTEFVSDSKNLPEDALLKAGMASCHSLTYINKELSGDPLELKMFEATDWSLEEAGEETQKFDMIMPTVVKPKGHASDIEVGILRQFTFESSLQRMSVITKNLSSPSFELFAKGSPEMITSLCKEETIPDDFADSLAEYTQHGYRVIALGHRILQHNYTKLQRIDRSEVEKELTFLGLVVMENRLKPETKDVISELNKANIRTIMVTGDNLLTAVSVARECGFISPSQKVVLVTVSEVDGCSKVEYHSSEVDNNARMEHVKLSQIQLNDDMEKGNYIGDDFCFALTGKTWSVIRKEHGFLLDRIAVKGAVFARMAPEQKAQLVEVLQSIGYYVAMCGDGANDCGALKAAHSGISLSEAEASVASPFTSKIANIQCVPQLIREGRAALVTSFGVFKFIAGYSLTQFTSVLLLYYIGANLTDFEFLYIDLVVITSLSITFPFTPPADGLYKHTPPVKLASLFPVMILVINFLIMAGVQIGAMFLTMAQPWFIPFKHNDEEEYISHENTAVFNVSCFQYIVLAVMFAQGAPFRKHMFTNIPFLINVIVVILLAVWLIMYPTSPVADFLELQLSPDSDIGFRAYFIAIGVANFILCLLVERLITGNETVRRKVDAIKCACSGNAGSAYEAVENEIIEEGNWPPIQETNDSFATVLHRESSIVQS